MNSREIGLLNQQVAKWWERQRVIPIAIGVAIGILIAVYTVSAQL